MPIETIGKHHRIQISRKRCAPQSFRYKTLSRKKGIKALFCCPAGQWDKGRCQNGMQMRTVLYPKTKYTKQQAKAHAKKIKRK